jgi:4-hydroxy-2-oxoheptanedioate aldolase
MMLDPQDSLRPDLRHRTRRTGAGGLRAALRGGPPIIATFVMLGRIEIVEMLASAGFDCVVFDLEHGAIEVSELPPLAASASGSGMFSIARLASGDPATMARVLDTGVDGVLVPHVESADDALRVVQAGRFPAQGLRSLNPYVRGLGYGSERSHEDAAEPVIVAMIEGAGGLKDVEAICGIGGLDGVFVGPMDLSAALGLPDQPEHELVVEAMREVFRVAKTCGLASSLYAPTVAAALRGLSDGARLISLSADVAMAVESFRTMRAALG